MMVKAYMQYIDYYGLAFRNEASVSNILTGILSNLSRMMPMPAYLFVKRDDNAKICCLDKLLSAILDSSGKGEISLIYSDLNLKYA